MEEIKKTALKPKNISKKEYDALANEIKGEKEGKRLLFVGTPGSPPLIEDNQFIIKEGKVRCSHIGYCKSCHNINIINSKAMCRNCYVISRRISNMSEEERNLYAKKKELQKEKCLLYKAETTYPDNLLYSLFFTREQKRAIRKSVKNRENVPVDFDKLASEKERQLLSDAMNTELTQKERDVLVMKFSKHMTFEDIGTALHVSRARASNINSQAISKLRAIYALAGAKKS